MKKSPKNPQKYTCVHCNYHTGNMKDYNKHLLTAKHLNRTLRTEKSQKSPKIPKSKFVCDCGKEYTARNSLWYHRKSCKSQTTESENVHDEFCSDIEVNESDVVLPDTNKISPGFIMELLRQNHEFKTLIIEQQQENQKQQQENHRLHIESQKLQSQLIEAVKDSGNVMTVNNNTTNNNNQKFNLNFFLNTTCKDAMNMSEFIENIEVNFKDIENIGKNGYVTGMTDMILSRIKELDVTKRPMHCTDLKRETMYIKDNNEWTKDTPENTRFHKMIDYVAKQNYAKMPLWRQRNPECLDSDHPKYDFCIKMMRNMLGDVGLEQKRLDNKVIKNLSRHILVDKGVN